jgi:hypothetical protein
VSDAALAALESTAAAERGARSRLSCSSVSRKHWFLGRAEHIHSFLMDQAKALEGQGAPALAAVTTADVSADSTLRGATGEQGKQTPVATVSDTECQLRVACAERATSLVAPMEYQEPNAQHVADNNLKVEFKKRKTCGTCFACLNTRVQYGTFLPSMVARSRKTTAHAF